MDDVATKQHMIDSAKKFGVELKDMQMIVFCWRQGHICVSAHWLWKVSHIWYSAICIR